MVAAAMTTTATTDIAICRLRFCALNSGRAISIAEVVATSAPIWLVRQVIETEDDQLTIERDSKEGNVRMMIRLFIIGQCWGYKPNQAALRPPRYGYVICPELAMGRLRTLVQIQSHAKLFCNAVF